MFSAIGGATVLIGIIEGLGRVWLWALDEEAAPGEWGCVLLARLACDVRPVNGYWAQRRRQRAKARQFPTLNG